MIQASMLKQVQVGFEQTADDFFNQMKQLMKLNQLDSLEYVDRIAVEEN